MGETPGPGSYGGTTASSALRAHPQPVGIQKHALNTISSAGDKFVRDQSSRNNFPSPRSGSPPPLTNVQNQVHQ